MVNGLDGALCLPPMTTARILIRQKAGSFLLLSGKYELMNGWLERLSTWQFAVFWGVCMFLSVDLAGALVQWLMRGRFDITFLVTYGLVFAVVTGIPATIKHRSRHPR